MPSKPIKGGKSAIKRPLERNSMKSLKGGAGRASVPTLQGDPDEGGEVFRSAATTSKIGTTVGGGTTLPNYPKKTK